MTPQIYVQVGPRFHILLNHQNKRYIGQVRSKNLVQHMRGPLIMLQKHTQIDAVTPYTKSTPVECRGLVAHCKTEEFFAEKIGPFLGTEFWSHPLPSHLLESLSVEDIYGKI